MTVFLQPGRRAPLKTTTAADAAVRCWRRSVSRASVSSAMAGRLGQYCCRPGRLLMLKLEMSIDVARSALPRICLRFK